jgi:DNA-binding transcriptional regulator LsrR (DeoR family)
MSSRNYSAFIKESKTLESDIIKMISGTTQGSVAKELGISQATISRILKKLGYRRKYSKEVGEGN